MRVPYNYWFIRKSTFFTGLIYLTHALLLILKMSFFLFSNCCLWTLQRVKIILPCVNIVSTPNILCMYQVLWCHCCYDHNLFRCQITLQRSVLYAHPLQSSSTSISDIKIRETSDALFIRAAGFVRYCCTLTKRYMAIVC